MSQCTQCDSEIPELVDHCPTCASPVPQARRRIGNAATAMPKTGVMSAASVAPPRSPEGALVDGRYRIDRQLARGGMGVVYRGTDVRLRRPVALKFLAAELVLEKELVSRFLREAQAAAAIDHPNVITVFAAGEHGGRPFMAMRFVDGETVAQRVEGRGPIPLVEAARIAAQACDGLARIHEHGFVHRDLKPANLMLEASGRAIILDFGILRIATSEFTRTGMVCGTLGFMSPEQATTPRAVDARSDVYGLGLTFYYMLTGGIPFAGETPVEIVLQQRTGEIPSARARCPELPAEVDAFFARALAVDPGDRYQSASAMREGLERLGATPAARPVVAAPKEADTRDTVVRTEDALRRRRRSASAVLIAVAVIAAGAFIGWLTSRGQGDLSPRVDTITKGDSAPGAGVEGKPGSAAEAVTERRAAAEPRSAVAAGAVELPAPPRARLRPARGKRAATAPSIDLATMDAPSVAPAPPAPDPSPPPAPAVGSAPAKPQRGSVRVLTTLRGKGAWSEIAIDDRVVGHTHAVTHDVDPGRHRVRVRREGFAEETRAFDVAAGERADVQIELRPTP